MGRNLEVMHGASPQSRAPWAPRRAPLARSGLKAAQHATRFATCRVSTPEPSTLANIRVVIVGECGDSASRCLAVWPTLVVPGVPKLLLI